MESQLANKTAVITGRGSGSGYAIAERFVQAGAQVVLASRNQQRLDDTVARLGPSVQAIAVDVANDDQVQHLCAHLDRIDSLVTCAGGALFGPVDVMPPQAVRDLFATRWGNSVWFTTLHQECQKEAASCCVQAQPMSLECLCSVQVLLSTGLSARWLAY
ncbi:MAG: SDR family oxidoreductase [Chloroflexi bacterium AL-W]|nr:SDR family oxidoreductase [Chloroflexi bacterium AL-N1]NOK71642.1 SDR family oxidoreductase [Chloroflexi bacterium AL-N10]NOK78942.1 SDR family oxidoreductase [Chloroflexi bacterium AL-N5]NOK86417.1 SDR family oxidoreductase [Chloroflexi bacterium AL-W]